MTNTSFPPVIVVGGGPVGLASTLELARFGVPSILIEQHSGVAWHPKTRNFNTRTMEIASRWGLDVYRRLRDIDTPPGWKSPIRFFTNLSQEERGHIASAGFEGPGPKISPAQPVMSSQDLLERILLDAAVATGRVEVRFNHRITELVADGSDGTAVARMRDLRSGEEYELEAPALVAADGADSMIRQSLGIDLQGERGIQHWVNCYFHAPIEEELGDRRGVLLFVADHDVTGVLQPLDAAGRWLCQIAVSQEDWSGDAWPDDRVRDWVRTATGRPDLDVEVRSVGYWRMNATVADRFRQGRVVLVGDAAHQFPPTGGLGVNTGIQGMHNAMWKLAYCVLGGADWSLLDTYERERIDPSRRTVEQSIINHRNVQRIGGAAYSGEDSSLDHATVIRESHRYGNHLGVEFGVSYTSQAVIPDGSAAPAVEDDYADYRPSATPGRRAPHVWLGRSGHLSTIHLFGEGFTLLAGPQGSAWRQAAAVASATLRIPIGCYIIGDPGLEDARGEFCPTYGLAEDGAALVRPDGIVAWRSATPSADPGLALTQALAVVLGRAVTPTSEAGQREKAVL